MTDITMTSADVQRLSDQLEARCADLDEQSRTHLQAIFSLAGEAVAARSADDEVSGFSFSFGVNFAGAGRTVPWAAFQAGANTLPGSAGPQNTEPGGAVSLNPQPLPPTIG